MYFAKNSAAVHWVRIIADLDEQQILIGVTAVSESCCQPVLQSSLEQWGVRFAKNSAAVHWVCITADQYERETFIGVTAVSQRCCQPVLHSSNE